MNLLNMDTFGMEMDQNAGFHHGSDLEAVVGSADGIRTADSEMPGIGALENTVMGAEEGIIGSERSPVADLQHNVLTGEQQEIRAAISDFCSTPVDPYLDWAPPYKQLVIMQDIQKAVGEIRDSDGPPAFILS